MAIGSDFCHNSIWRICTTVSLHDLTFYLYVRRVARGVWSWLKISNSPSRIVLTVIYKRRILVSHCISDRRYRWRIYHNKLVTNTIYVYDTSTSCDRVTFQIGTVADFSEYEKGCCCSQPEGSGYCRIDPIGSTWYGSLSSICGVLCGSYAIDPTVSLYTLP